MEIEIQCQVWLVGVWCERQNVWRSIYQSSSSSFFPCIALCLALNASARPPAKLALFMLLGVARPLPPDESCCEFMLVTLSRGAAGGGSLRPMGRLAGGAGGGGLAFAAAPTPEAMRPVPLGVAVLDCIGGARGGGGATGAGAAATISSRYDWGAQPWALVFMFMQSHQPVKC